MKYSELFLYHYQAFKTRFLRVVVMNILQEYIKMLCIQYNNPFKMFLFLSI